ncbi:MAG: C1 family peptidase [Fimbriimonas sp.]
MRFRSPFLIVLLVSPLAVMGLAAGQRGGAFELTPNLRRATQSPNRVRMRNLHAQRHVDITPYQVGPIKHVDLGKIKLVGSTDLRPQIVDYGLAIRAQGSRGTCSVFALTFCQEYMTAKKTGKKNLDLSEEYLNFVGDIAAGSKKDGGFYSDLNDGYQGWGNAPESALPYQSSYNPAISVPEELAKAGASQSKLSADFIKEWDPNRGANDAELQKVLANLDQGIPVAVGLLWPQKEKWKTNETNGVQLMSVVPRSDTFDGHSVVIVGSQKNDAFPGGGFFVFRNSWGAGWGDKGYGYMSFEYVKQYANDLMTYK